MRKVLTDPKLAELIHEIVLTLETKGVTSISLGDTAFGELDCSRQRLYRVARRYCETWGYRYQPVTYRSSRAYYRKPFEVLPDNEMKAAFTKPAIIKAEK